ncbi:hypothetical protein [Prochlorothrix hollandica]|nr:hypothetical protein [Prochlorothrix hollandica]
MVAPVVGRQEGRHGGENPTRIEGSPGKYTPGKSVPQVCSGDFSPSGL